MSQGQGLKELSQKVAEDVGKGRNGRETLVGLK